MSTTDFSALADRLTFAVDVKTMSQNVDNLASFAVLNYEATHGIKFDDDTRNEAEAALKKFMWRGIKKRKAQRMQLWEMLFNVAKAAYKEHVSQSRA